MHREHSGYDATSYKDVIESLELRRANIMHLVDLKRGGYSARRTELRINPRNDRPMNPRAALTCEARGEGGRKALRPIGAGGIGPVRG
ncbi:hypothetical protein SAMN05444581_12724 [Methylocapsa palsarum]|uniref:Uncharacterized protein n=1 Tax=Methylocapsa palsarum TaxID=1612308 RepID=A0A1I4CRI8_9HYPH|nr:hypothetical protein SAMN05444581_12724 [Methylocapsa palsarum]